MTSTGDDRIKCDAKWKIAFVQSIEHTGIFFALLFAWLYLSNRETRLALSHDENWASEHSKESKFRNTQTKLPDNLVNVHENKRQQIDDWIVSLFAAKLFGKIVNTLTDLAHTTDKTNLNHFERVLAPLFYDSATMHIFLKQTARKFHPSDKIFLLDFDNRMSRQESERSAPIPFKLEMF